MLLSIYVRKLGPYTSKKVPDNIYSNNQFYVVIINTNRKREEEKEGLYMVPHLMEGEQVSPDLGPRNREQEHQQSTQPLDIEEEKFLSP